jgi:serine/threonine protein kinase
MAEHAKHEGQQLGKNRLICLFGRAGFSKVYLREHLHRSARVAIKVLQTNVGDSQASSFRDDARTTAHLFHPYIVPFHDFAVNDGTLFLGMEYVLAAREEVFFSDFGLVVLTSRTHSYRIEEQLTQEVTEITESNFFQYLLH